MKTFSLVSPEPLWDGLTDVQPDETNLNDHINAGLAQFLIDHHDGEIDDAVLEEITAIAPAEGDDDGS